MYAKHFDLLMLPFENVPDPVFFFDQGEHARVHNRIKDSLKAGRGLMLVTGPIGSGKTTLSQMMISEFSSDIKLIWMAQPPGNSTELFLFIAQGLRLKPKTFETTFVLRDIRNSLLRINSKGSKCLVIIDESHMMSDDTINGIRLLNNLEEGATKLIQILLLGQEELLDIINRPEMEHFKQRIATLQMLGKMNSDRIREYISYRLEVAGRKSSIFTDTGWEALRLAFGPKNIPRLVNSLCDRSLSAAFEREKKIVDVDDVYEAADEMGLGKEVFHYKISLKQKERKKPPMSVIENDSSEAPETIYAEPAHPIKKEPYKSIIQQVSRQLKAFHLNHRESMVDHPISEGDQKNLKIPVAFLFISISVLILSISFYCRRSDSTGLLSCLLELIGL
jgi:general secretion pathway protein A